MSLKLYCDLMSQPSRALYIVLKQCNTPFEFKYVNLRKGEHMTAEFEKINRIGKVPVIEHNGFYLTESVVIIRYLAHHKLISDQYYPNDFNEQIRLDEFLNWQHIGFRAPVAMYFRKKYLEPVITGIEPDPIRIKEQFDLMEDALQILETKWLGEGRKYVVGNKISFGDLLAACEIEQPRMAGYDAKLKFPNIASWMARVRKHFNPRYDEAHVTLNKVVNKYNSLQAKL